jgi:tetratricopeptide (TPR) repeat protein
LLLEAADVLAEEGWECGWLRDVADAAQVAAGAAGGLGRPVLLLVDDADTRSDLGALLSTLPGAEGVRVVLAAREFGGWWQQLMAGLDARTVRALMPIRRTRLGWLDATAPDRQQRFTQAVGALARADGVRVPEVELVPSVAPVPVLLVQAAAAAAVAHGMTGRVDIDEVLPVLFTDEERRWQRHADAQGLGAGLAALRGGVVFAVLAGADSLEDAVDLVRAVPGCPPDREEFANFIRALHQQTAGRWLNPHLPGMLVQRYAATCLATDPALIAALAAAIMSRDALPQRRTERAQRVLASLASAAAHTPAAQQAMAALLRHDPVELLPPCLEVALRGLGPVDQVIADTVVDIADTLSEDRLSVLWSAVPPRTIELARTAAALARVRLDRASDEETRARCLDDLGYRLGELGRYEDALSATTEALTIRRRLAAAHPDAHEPGLADTLHNLGIHLGELGRHQDAESAYQEAATTRRRHAERTKPAHPN